MLVAQEGLKCGWDLWLKDDQTVCKRGKLRFCGLLRKHPQELNDQYQFLLTSLTLLQTGSNNKELD